MILLIAILLLGGIALFGALMYLGTAADRTLTSMVGGRLHPGEEVIFQSQAMWRSFSFPAALFSLSQGYIVITDRRMFLATFNLLWPTITETWLRDIDEVQLPASFPWGWIKISYAGKTRMIEPYSGRLLNYPTDLADNFVEALNRGRLALA